MNIVLRSPVTRGGSSLANILSIGSPAVAGMQGQMTGTIGRQRLSSEPIGITTVTFSGINANSEIRVFRPDGTEAAGVELCDVDHTLVWDSYPMGNSNNVVTIRIIHPAYKIKEFSFTSTSGNVTLPIQQEIDKWYKNPT